MSEPFARTISLRDELDAIKILVAANAAMLRENRVGAREGAQPTRANEACSPPRDLHLGLTDLRQQPDRAHLEC